MSVTRKPDLAFVSLPGRDSADGLAGIASTSSARYVKMKSTAGRTAHRHPLSEEVVLVVSGQGAVWIDGSLTGVGPGDIVHVPLGAAHATLPDEGQHMELMCFFPHPDLTANIEQTDIEVS